MFRVKYNHSYAGCCDTLGKVCGVVRELCRDKVIRHSDNIVIEQFSDSVDNEGFGLFVESFELSADDFLSVSFLQGWRAVK